MTGQLGQDAPHSGKCEDTGKTEKIEGVTYKIFSIGAKSGDTLSHLVQRCCGKPGGPSLWKVIADKNGLKNVGTEKEPNYAIQPCKTYQIYCPQNPAEKHPKEPEPAKPSELEQQNIADKKKMIANLEELQKGYQEQFDKEKDLDKKNEIQKKLEDVKTRLIDWRKRLDEELATLKEKKTGMAPGQRPGTIVTAADKAKWNTEENVADLARIIMSEASVGNAQERSAVGYTVLNRMKRNGKDKVKDVQRGFATNQEPTEAITEFTRKLLRCEIEDNSQGATHFYSPESMPKEGEEGTDKFRGFDTKGGLEKTPGVDKKNYKPGWATDEKRVQVEGARESKYKFYREPGSGPVR